MAPLFNVKAAVLMCLSHSRVSSSRFPSYILPIHGTDVVLGVQWLQTLGKFLSDYIVTMIQFSHNHKTITLTGNTATSPTPASFAQFSIFLFTDAIDTMHVVSLTQLDSTLPAETLTFDTSNLDPNLAQLLTHYSTIFSIPQGLPPPCNQDHHIHLLPSSQRINVRPYRYPQCHKDVMTSMIQEMLKEGIIKPSTSPFSSPVILVKKKKKDGTWRFCVDYRVLNAIIVKDRFPIPTVDELLDELHGYTIFSKLDLRFGYHQILSASEDTFKTSLRTIDGHFEFLVMPFGISNAPSTFQATMNDIFRALLRRFVLVFF